MSGWHPVLNSHIDQNDIDYLREIQNSKVIAGIVAVDAILNGTAGLAWRNDLVTGGVGFSPFNTVHLDLMGLYGEQQTRGAGAQLSVTF